MGETVTALMLDESKWLTASMSVALAGAAVLVWRRPAMSRRRRTFAAAMNLFFGLTIGMMAFGHLAAVTIKLAMGTLEGPVPYLYAIGVAVAAPSWWLVRHSMASGFPETGDRLAVVLNAWAAATLLGLGLHNLPLAAPALFNIAYLRHSRPALGLAAAALFLAVNGGLFVAALVFMASGQTFEQFQGLE
jgi:hypothetical protein